MKIIKYSLVTFLSLFILVAIAASITAAISPPSAKPIPQPVVIPVAETESPIAPVKPASLPHYRLEAIAKDYVQNTIKADEKYKGKRFITSGRVLYIDTDILGNPYVMVTSINRSVAFQLLFTDVNKAKVTELKNDAILKVNCEGYGQTLGQLMAKDCEII